MKKFDLPKPPLMQKCDICRRDTKNDLMVSIFFQIPDSEYEDVDIEDMLRICPECHAEIEKAIAAIKPVFND